MPKKRNQKKKAGQPRIRSLEYLLRTGQERTYGQLCWSLGNRGTRIHRPGQVITLGGLGQNGESMDRKLRLTEQSIENINQCLGLRTCG